MMQNVLLAACYIPTIGPRVLSVGMYKDDIELEILKGRAKEYATGMSALETVKLVTLPIEAMNGDTTKLIKELRDEAVAKYAQLHPNEMASDDEVRMEEDIEPE